MPEKSAEKSVRSMTGFGSERLLLPLGEILTEIKSVNGKSLDIRLNLPRGFFALEMEIRKRIREKISRGTLQLQITILNSKENTFDLAFDRLQKLSEKLKEQCELIGFKPEGNIDTLLRLYQLEKEDEPAELEEEAAAVLTCVDSALEKLLETRQLEGAKLRQDLLDRLPALKGIVSKIKQLAPSVVSDYKKRITEQLKELSAASGVPFDPVRILTEVGVFSEKVDITEELTRLSCHLELYQNTLSSGGVIGRKLDFITQEAFREITTCGNKASNAEISSLVVAMKEELEKMREQAQNIE